MTCASLWSRRLGITVIVLGLWEAAYRLGIFNPLIFGSPSLMIAAALTDGRAFLAAFESTAYEIVAATRSPGWAALRSE